MPAVTFTELLADAARSNIIVGKSKKSLTWFRQNAGAVTDINSTSLIRQYDKKELQIVTNITVGKLYFMMYDPKHKKTLPYYDLFPCIFPIEPYADGSFLAINLHYLPPVVRAKLMDALYGLEAGKLSKSKKLELSYGILKGAAKFGPFKPCIKRYLKSQIRSRFIAVPYEQWQAAIFLPVHEFVKASAAKVWADSRKKI
jgi:hypothetical protein